MSRNWIARFCALGVMLGAAAVALGSVQDASIIIDHAANSPSLTVRYSGANVALVELVVNGASVGTRNTDPSSAKGETHFTIDLSTLNSGDNDVEVRLYDKDGKLLGTESSSVASEQGGKAPVFLSAPKLGATVQGPLQVSVGFGKDLHNTYVSFFVDNQFKSMTNTPPFAYIWDTTRDANGWHEVEAWVVDDSSTTYKTRKIKVYVNNPGGNTVRQFSEPSVSPIAPAPKMAVNATPTVAALKGPQLQVSASNPSVAIQTAGLGTKSATLAATQAVQATHAVVPAIAASVAPKAAVVAPITNAVRADIGVSSGIKTEATAETVASGPRMLLPTGKRVASSAKPALSGPIGRTPKTAVVKSKVEVLPEVQPSAAITAQKADAASHAIANANTASTIAITHGTKIAAVKTFSISLDSKTVKFDAAKPQVKDNVPLTPFRYLFEQSGGKVAWHDKAKSVTASNETHEIFIKIGDKLAKVNNLPVQLDLTPFIDHGRTIVPLSFIQDALDVEVEYDPATNHVLITSIKKKKS